MTENQANLDAPVAPEDTLLIVDSVEQFALCVQAWHHNVVAQLKMAVNVPDDVAVVFSPGEGQPERELKLEERPAFKAGVVIALSLFEQLPFQRATDEQLAEAAAQNQADDEEGTGQ